MAIVFLHSELYEAKQACVMEDRCVPFICGKLCACGVCVWCVCVRVECVSLLLRPYCPCFGPLLSSCLNTPMTKAFILLILPSLIFFSQIVHLLPVPPFVSGCPLVPLPSCPHIFTSLLSFSCTLILLLKSFHSHPFPPPTPLPCSPTISFLTALGKLVDLVSPARTQWSPACCPGNNGRSLTNFILSKEQKKRVWRRARRMTFFLIWGMFIKHKSRPTLEGGIAGFDQRAINIHWRLTVLARLYLKACSQKISLHNKIKLIR